MTQENIEVFELIKNNASQNNIIYETADGMFAENIDVFVNRDLNDLLNKLNLDITEVMSRADQDDSRFVNDLALINLICYFKENWVPVVES